ncbi:topless-related protein 4-like isoform X2 [Vigna radiata var. radiata]|uniref:Topless-related protein 4-like isoform X2 n=1 Tax=Vigna radiata var. radiata TaxID=3916 RepID=A0A3Q0EQM6_VIGRR|nr:topless-related protein 4-like isoform X2 [Vigna radiata var. radiata]
MFWFLLWCWTLSHVYPFQPTPAPVPTSLVGWMSNPTTVEHPAVSGGAIGLGAPSILGVAYLRHIVQIYSYHGGDEVRQHLEVWDAASGAKQYTFEGHKAPIYSVGPHYKENIQFIFSTTLDGKIKAWLYDNLGSRVDYDNLESFGGYGGPMRSYGRMYDSLDFDDGILCQVQWR